MTRVLIVDDQRTAREVLKQAVSKTGKYTIEKIIADAATPIFLS